MGTFISKCKRYQ